MPVYYHRLSLEQIDQDITTNLGRNRILWELNTANMNVTTDQLFIKKFAFTNYLVDRIVASNPSVSLTTAQGGIYDGAGKTGNVIVASAQMYSALVNPTDTLALTLNDTDIRTNSNLYLSLTTPQGSVSTAIIRIMGWALS